MTRLVLAISGSSLPNELPMAEMAPCSRTSGCPVPWIS